jgi:hypothetical protein
VAAQRSPAASIDEINANQPAVFLANAFNDSLFPPGQLVDFFNRLKGPSSCSCATATTRSTKPLAHWAFPTRSTTRWATGSTTT